ncbi:MAG: NAD(P)H-dependent oxidoreductase subunit E [Deltaproteobacteria bacterium]|nr:NAD(P)H-dependent oxidoreductase subunit E [Deltaproteobacteria bacterium]
MGKAEIVDILSRHVPQEQSLIEILHDIQLRFRHLPPETLSEVARHCSVPLARVYSVATFYTAFTFTKKGDTVCRICMGTACHVKGAQLIREEAEKMLGIAPGQTTPDGKYSLEVVNCVGACAMAPVVIVNEAYQGKFRPMDLKKLLGRGE